MTVKCENFENRTKDVTIGYSTAYVIYFIIAVFGSIGCLGRNPDFKDKATISDFFLAGDIAMLLLNVFFSF